MDQCVNAGNESAFQFLPEPVVFEIGLHGVRAIDHLIAHTNDDLVANHSDEKLRGKSVTRVRET